MKYKLILLEDIINYGRKGDLVAVAPGYARNFLLPKNKALLASQTSLSLREKLQKERKEQQEKDRKASLELAKTLEKKEFTTTVKVDPAGHMYGSITAVDIVEILKKEGVTLTKKNVLLSKPLKQIGTHPLMLNLPEDVQVSVAITLKPDREIKKAPVKKEESKKEETEKKEISSEEEKEAKTEA